MDNNTCFPIFGATPLGILLVCFLALLFGGDSRDEAGRLCPVGGAPKREEYSRNARFSGDFCSRC